MNRERLGRLGPAAILLVVAAVAPYLVGSYYVSLISLALVAAILASSINFLAGNAGLVSLGTRASPPRRATVSPGRSGRVGTWAPSSPSPPS